MIDIRHKFQNIFQMLGGFQGHGTAKNLLEFGLGVSICKSENYETHL